MVPTTSNPTDRHAHRRQHVAAGVTVAVATVLAVLNAPGGNAALAQQPPHYRHSAMMPPGTVGREQLARGGPLPGYFQPVEIGVPPGALVSLVADGRFLQPQPDRVMAGMLIGQVYRFKVTGIPGHEGFEVYPTIEVINRLYPPPGQAVKFPIPIQLLTEEIELALGGQFVTRVIYLENPDDAFPRSDEPGTQRYFEVLPGQDPLEIADRLGRPMAILRLGSRVPDEMDADGRFEYGSAPLLLLNPAAARERGN